MTLRVAIADDQVLVRTGFRLVLEQHGDAVVTGEAETGRSAIALARRTVPDIVLMDVRMPDMDGITATRAITTSGPSKVIVLTTFDDDRAVELALAAGASAFLLKDVHPQVLLSTLWDVHERDGQVRSAGESRRRGLVEPAHHSEELARRAQVTRLEVLTAREYDVFLAVGQGLTNEQISARLVVTESTVKTHVGRILSKLELQDRVAIVILAYESGVIGA